VAESSLPAPRYTIWQGINVAIQLSMRALEEVRAFIRDGGKPGPPGLGFDDFEIEYDGKRGFIFRLAREGMAPKERTFTVPAQIYCGVYKDGRWYERGDTATWGGSLYHCNEPTTDKPGAGSSAWSLAVKRGEDGRSAFSIARKNGFSGTEKEWLESMRGQPGAPGRPGRDLTQIGPDGSKWG
jgi:integrin beta 3